MCEGSCDAKQDRQKEVLEESHDGGDEAGASSKLNVWFCRFLLNVVAERCWAAVLVLSLVVGQLL